MKKKQSTNYSGIRICDSITMSAKEKRHDMRKLEALIIAVIGFVSVIKSFLDMFEFSYNTKAIVAAAVFFSAVYIVIAFSGKKALWITGASFLIFAAAVYRFLEPVISGFKYVYNIIYTTSKHTNIMYYKYLDPDNEYFCITIFFAFCIWLIAMVVYVFTIRMPNPIPVVAVTFPIIETGLYNGIKIPIFWGILTVGYWLAIASMYGTDLGEYYDGNSGFVRKDNLFFPKRQMRFKITEKCGCILLVVVMSVTACTLAVMSLTNYERSENLKQKRVAIKEAANSFSMDDVASSLSALTEAFGFTINYESHKLGTVDHINYKNVTELTATFDRSTNGAIYLKGYAGSIYNNNEWVELDDSAYKNSVLFDDFKSTGIYPQDFLHIFANNSSYEGSDITVWLEAKRKKNKSFAPYGTNNYGGLSYDYDLNVSSKETGSDSYSYKFTEIDKSNIFDLINNISLNDESQLQDAASLENEYRSFVYDNYLQIPDNESMSEVRDSFSDILDTASSASTAEEKLALLDSIRERINSMTEYTLSPGETPSNRDFVNYFLLENHKGYCIHYATAGVLLARMAGIPARYATGYIIVGDDFSDENMNSDGTYTIDVQDNRSHAWAEIYLDGFGWVPFEFTKGYSESSIETAQETTEEITEEQLTSASTEPTVTNQQSSQSSISHESHEKSSSPTTTYTTSITTTDSQKNAVASAKSKPLSKTEKNILISASAVILIFLLIYLRRCIIISIRRKHFTHGSNNRRTTYMYDYAEKLLSVLKISRGEMQYTEFAAYADDMLSPEYFDCGEFRSFMSIVLEGSFGGSELSDEKTAQALEFTRIFSRTIYAKSNVFRKLIMKLIVVLI